MHEPEPHTFHALGSECVLHLFGAPLELAAAAEAEVRRIEARYSRYRPDSVLSAINAAAAQGGELELDEETAALIDYAYAVHRKSHGLFDITTGILRRAFDFRSGTLPDPARVEELRSRIGLDKLCWERPWLSFPVPGLELDLGGIGKEYAADRAAGICAEAGLEHGLVDLGGDLRAIGPRPDGAAWSIRLRHPTRPGEAFAALSLRQGGLATSGDYERCIWKDGRRYGHILDPRTGWPVRGLASVSVIADSCLLAGSFATSALLMGDAGPEWLRQLGVAAVWMDESGQSGSTLAPAASSRHST
jgi:thiamine biosynthesis lipoprotein